MPRPSLYPAAAAAPQPPGKGRGRPARKPVGDQSNVTAQASQWKTSREELENTRQDVNARMDSYEETVNNLLG